MDLPNGPGLPHRLQSPGEELANSITHGIAFLAALIGTPFLIGAALQKGSALTISAVSVFAASTVLLYLCSMIFHGLPVSRAKRMFELLDHCAIYLLIAGTYTPFALCVLRGTLGWILFGLVWSAALLGITITLIPKPHQTKMELGLYLGMGWVVVFFFRTLYQHLPWSGVLWLIAGGVAYTVGVIFYMAQTPRYCHFVWHLFTVAGTTCHFIAVLCYVI